MDQRSAFEEEQAVFTSTGKIILERMASEINGSRCPFGPCAHCDNGRLPALSRRASSSGVGKLGLWISERELYDKLLLAGVISRKF